MLLCTHATSESIIYNSTLLRNAVQSKQEAGFLFFNFTSIPYKYFVQRPLQDDPALIVMCITFKKGCTDAKEVRKLENSKYNTSNFKFFLQYINKLVSSIQFILRWAILRI